MSSLAKGFFLYSTQNSTDIIIILQQNSSNYFACPMEATIATYNGSHFIEKC